MGLARTINKLVLDTPFENAARQIYIRLALSQGMSYERELQQLLKRILRRNSNCIDIGAYRGAVLRELLKHAPHGAHYAFEPVPQQYRYLIKSFPNVRVYPYALSDTAQELPFHHVVSRPTYSGLRKIPYPGACEQVEILQVQTELLDNVIPPNVAIQFIKVDVEGGELQVFRGACQTIFRNKPMVVFEHGRAAQHYGTASEEIYGLLHEECGLKISLMKNWLQAGTPLTVGQFVEEVAEQRNYYFMAHP